MAIVWDEIYYGVLVKLEYKYKWDEYFILWKFQVSTRNMPTQVNAHIFKKYLYTCKLLNIISRAFLKLSLSTPLFFQFAFLKVLYAISAIDKSYPHLRSSSSPSKRVMLFIHESIVNSIILSLKFIESFVIVVWYSPLEFQKKVPGMLQRLPFKPARGQARKHGL